MQFGSVYELTKVCTVRANSSYIDIEGGVSHA